MRVLRLVLLLCAAAACAAAQPSGMTWSHTQSNPAFGTITVACNGCNAYQGDTICTQLHPLLCIYKAPFSVPSGLPNDWSGGVVATTAPVAGNSFPTLADADKYCVVQFGTGWRTAEFHDGWGWHFQAYGGTSAGRFWVNI